MLERVRELHPEPLPRNPVVAWKLVVAAEAPWIGEIYPTRNGGQRLRFSTAETFCGALLAVTGWPIHEPRRDFTDHSTSTPAGKRSVRRARSRPTSERPSTKRKFIVAADEPWTGDIYRTRPGLGHFHFGTFEDFLRAILDLTEWPLEGDTLRGDDVEAWPGVTQPISGRQSHSGGHLE